MKRVIFSRPEYQRCAIFYSIITKVELLTDDCV